MMKVALHPVLNLRPGKTEKPKASAPASASARSNCPSEHQEQKALMLWARAQIGKGRKALQNLFAVPNGGHREKAVAGKLKAEGVASGVPDLFLAWPTKQHHGLFIEMKRRAKGQVSAEQKAWHERLRSAGYCVVIAKGFEEAITAIGRYLEPLSKGDGL